MPARTPDGRRARARSTNHAIEAKSATVTMQQRAPRYTSVGSDPPLDLANDISDTFRPNLRGVLTITRDLAMLTGPERDRSAIPGHGDLAAQHHNAHVEAAMCMHFFDEVWLLTAMNDLEGKR